MDREAKRSEEPVTLTWTADDFDLEQTLESGQVFHWQRRESAGGEHSWRGLIGDDLAVCLSQPDGPGTALRAETARRCSAADKARIESYLALDHRPAEIHATLPLDRDEHLRQCVESCGWLRIIRQPLWECLATFITSSMKQVAHIRQISEALRRSYGNPVNLGKDTLWSFPSAERLGEISEMELRQKIRLGWRAKTLPETARAVAAGDADLGSIAGMGYEDAHRALCKLPGVGPKVANCVLLFGCGHLGAFPIDVWIERVLRETYFPRRKRKPPTAGELRRFCQDYFGRYGGYAQQYLFHYARMEGRRAEQKAPKPSPRRHSNRTR